LLLLLLLLLLLFLQQIRLGSSSSLHHFVITIQITSSRFDFPGFFVLINQFILEEEEGKKDEKSDYKGRSLT
jgi:hypothetical protein